MNRMRRWRSFLGPADRQCRGIESDLIPMEVHQFRPEAVPVSHKDHSGVATEHCAPANS